MPSKKPYCKPHNAGLASEPSAVCKRIADLFTALETEINTFIVEGEIINDLYAFRRLLRERLEADGWTLAYGKSDRIKVRQPGHRRPFKDGK